MERSKKAERNETMLNIAIVDDSPDDITRLTAFLSSYAQERKYGLSVTGFSDGESFTAHFERGKYSLIFLDILMSGMDGMETARRLRAIDPDVLLVFVSVESDYAVEGYEVDASAFLVKTEQPDPKRFDRLMRRLEQKLIPNAQLDLSDRYAALFLPTSSVQYAEVTDHRMTLHADDGTYTLRMTMKEFTARLPDDGRFGECHRGVLINLDKIQSLEDQVVIMKSGDRLPVSRSRRQELKKAYATRNFARLREEFT